MKKTRIIAAFPATGKSTLAKTNPEKYLDLDSSNFSKLEDGSPNPEFPNNYIEAIKGYIGKVEYILVSSHLPVKRALHEEGLAWVYVVPDQNLMVEWVGRCYMRGDSKEFIDQLISNWDIWLDRPWSTQPNGLSRLGPCEYLSDKLHFLETVTYN